MKIALVGVGKIALDQHVPAIAESSEWELAATVSLEGEVEGVPSYRDLGLFLKEQPDVETVSVCTPPLARFDCASAALKAGRNVMLEKPPGATLSECYALRELARERRQAIFATWHSREAAQVGAARQWLARKRLRRMRVIWKEDARQWHPGQRWIWEAGGMGVFDPGINALSIVTQILPVRIHLTEAELTFPSNCQAPSAASLRFAHPDGAEVTAEMDFVAEGDPIWTIELETEEGSAVLSMGGAVLTIDGVEQPVPGSHSPFVRRAGAAPIGPEYPQLYDRMAAYAVRAHIDMDLSPMEHVVDAFAIACRKEGPEFHDPALSAA